MGASRRAVFRCILRKSYCSSPPLKVLCSFLLFLIYGCKFIELEYCHLHFFFLYSVSDVRLCWQHLLWTAGRFQLWYTVTAPVHTSSIMTPSSTLRCALFWKLLEWIKSPWTFPWTSIWNIEGCHHADSYRFIGKQLYGLEIQQTCWELACGCFNSTREKGWIYHNT